MINDDADAFSGLVAFLAVADTLGFRTAATKLGITAAAVSRSVQKLEDRLGVRLFERTTRTVRLTREGERYATRCREAIEQLRLAQAEVQDASRALAGTLRVSASPILSRIVIPRLGRLIHRHPGLRVSLSLSDKVVRFAEEDVDVALRVGPVADDSLVARVLLETTWLTVASPTYLARRGVPERASELAGHDCLRFAPRGGKPPPWTLASGAHDARGSVDIDLGDGVVDAAIADIGVARVLDFMAEAALRDGRLVEILPDERVPGPRVHAVHPSGRRASPRVRAFVAFLGEELARRQM